ERLVSFGEPREAYDTSETIVKTIARFEERMTARGMPEMEMRKLLAELDGIMDAVELERAHETEPLPGAKEALTALRARGVKVGVLTRACEEYAEKVLSLTGMRELVDAIEPRNSQVRPKPHPDAYLRLAAKMGVRPEETVFVGDHPIDATCAARAGVAFIAVGTGDVSEEAMAEAGSAAFVPDVGRILALIERSLG
ncbi:MAG: HAD family hydrolase, partial [Thermoplasmata archaeon]|nr:HAD family hydrolase [Thermoplasmata archaeon]